MRSYVERARREDTRKALGVTCFTRVIRIAVAKRALSGTIEYDNRANSTGKGQVMNYAKAFTRSTTVSLGPIFLPEIY